MKPIASWFSMGLLLSAAAVALVTSQQLASAAPTQTPAPAEPPAVAQTPPLPESPLPSVPPEVARGVAALAGGGIKPEDVRATPVPGVFELRRGSEIIYMSQDGRYVFTGDLYRVEGRTNLTEARKAQLRKQLIDAVPEGDMVVYSPSAPRYTVTVFTDVDCPYCQAFHKQIADYNRLGIKVRYVFFPRSGPNTESWHKAEQVWCSTDRQAALTESKLGKPLTAKVCADTPVAREYQLGKDVGLEGTPGIVAADGTMVGGYLPPDKLLQELKQLSP
jgi:thiol:disulfide interchange protein DsbC